MGIIYRSLRPAIFRQDPEKAHNRVLALGEFAQRTGHCGLLKKVFEYSDPRLECEVNGVRYRNPVGLAAGFDKNGEVCEFIESLGFGFMEVGSVTYQGGKGNSKPRIVRLPHDYALINRMGLNNNGAFAVKENLSSRKNKFPIGVNLAKTHSEEFPIVGEAGIKDFLYNYWALKGIGNFKVLNISCPNTTEGKTFEDPAMLKELLNEIYLHGDVSRLYIKLSPDLTDNDLDNILQVAEDAGVNGYVLSNTSVNRNNFSEQSRKIAEEFGKGGLSGLPIKELSTEMIRKVFRHTRKTIIGVGGISTAEDAYEKIEAGARLVEVYTGMVYKGPGIAKQINKGLVGLMERDGVKNISEVVGVAI